MGQNFEMFFRVRTVSKGNYAQYALAGGEMPPNGRSLFRRLLLPFHPFLQRCAEANRLGAEAWGLGRCRFDVLVC